MGTRGRWIVFSLVFCLATVAAGCGKNGRTMTAVSGTVTLDGVPVDDGQILFRRVDGEQKGYEAAIKSGAYQLRCEPGEVKIEITAYRVVPGKFTTVNGPKEPVMEMYIPEQYNTKTTLTKSLKGSNNSLPFELTTK